jgi:hypothetical protein
MPDYGPGALKQRQGADIPPVLEKTGETHKVFQHDSSVGRKAPGRVQEQPLVGFLFFILFHYYLSSSGHGRRGRF